MLAKTSIPIFIAFPSQTNNCKLKDTYKNQKCYLFINIINYDKKIVMRYNTLLFISLLLFSTAMVMAQTNQNRYATSTLLGRQQVEIKVFNSLYTQKAEDYRSNFFTSFTQVLVGVNHKINVGFDLKYRMVNYGNTPLSPFSVFTFENTPLARQAVTAFGPKIKIAPFPAYSNVSIQSTFFIPIGKDLQGGNNKPYIDNQGFSWWTQVFVDKPLGAKFSLFTEADIFIDNLKKEVEQASIYLPLKAILSYFPTQRTTLYVSGEITPYLQPFLNYYLQTGLGAKYELMPNQLEVELLYTLFSNQFLMVNKGRASTLNVGIRWTR